MQQSPETQIFATQIALHMEYNLPRIEKCIAILTEDEVWQRPNPASNSIGNLVIHLCGNMTQYILCSLGGQPDHRERAAEFAATSGFSKAELLEKLHATVDRATQIIRSASSDELLRMRRVQGFQMSGIAIAIHVCEHFSYHTGQIAFWTKLLKNKDLDFYAGTNLNAKNE